MSLETERIADNVKAVKNKEKDWRLKKINYSTEIKFCRRVMRHSEEEIGVAYFLIYSFHLFMPLIDLYL